MFAYPLAGPRGGGVPGTLPSPYRSNFFHPQAVFRLKSCQLIGFFEIEIGWSRTCFPGAPLLWINFIKISVGGGLLNRMT